MLPTDMAILLGTANMSSHMNDKKAYQVLLKEVECLKNREHCQRQCSSCPFGGDCMEKLKGYTYIEAILKARCPELYFAQTLQQLQEMLEQ